MTRVDELMCKSLRSKMKKQKQSYEAEVGPRSAVAGERFCCSECTALQHQG